MKFHRLFFFILSFVIIGIFITPRILLGAKGIESFIGIQEEYTDNLYLKKENKKDEFITTLDGGIKIAKASEKKSLEGEFEGKFIFHNDSSQEDRTELNGNINGKYSFGKRDTLSLKVSERRYYEKKFSYEAEEPGNLSEIRILAISPSVRLLLARGGLDAGYKYVEKRYQDPNFTDNYDYSFFLQLDQMIGKRISAFLGYTYLSRHYKGGTVDSELKAYQDQGGNIGLKLQMPMEFNGQIRYAYIWREYEQAQKSEYYTFEGELERSMGRKIAARFFYGIGQHEEVGDFIYGNEEKYRRWSGEIKVTLKKRHIITANYGEGFYQDLHGSTYKRYQGQIEIAHDFYRRIKLTYSGYYIRDKYKDDNRKETVTGGMASLKILLTKRSSFLISGDYEEKKFDPFGWRDRYIEGQGGLDYKILSWLSSSFSYTYIDNRSNKTKREYTNNRYAVAIKAFF